MTPESFAYWLQGFFELSGTDKLTEEQVRIVKDHLALVFNKVTPDRSKKKKAKKKTSALEEAARLDLPLCEPVTTVSPPVNPNQISIEVEEYLKKKQRKDQDQFIVTCDSTPTPEQLIEKVKDTVTKTRERPYSSTRWIGGGFGQRYC